MEVDFDALNYVDFELPYNSSSIYNIIKSWVMQEPSNPEMFRGTVVFKKISTSPEKNMTFSAVVADNITAPVETIKVMCGKILDKKRTTAIIQKLNSIRPVPTLSHLKRVKWSSEEKCLLVILDVLDNLTGLTNPAKKRKLESGESSRKELLKACGIDLDDLALNDIVECDVCAQPPLTKKQNELCGAMWPTHFHPNLLLEKELSQEVFSDIEIKKHEAWMNYVSRKELALVVNPKSNTIVAEGSSCKDQHPLLHSTMAVIDEVAKVQLALKTPKDEDSPYLCTGYDLYIWSEPCIMCCMALVHSRIQRVFFHLPSQYGGLKTLSKIHTLPGLNHHYSVYQSIIE